MLWMNSKKKTKSFSPSGAHFARSFASWLHPALFRAAVKLLYTSCGVGWPFLQRSRISRASNVYFLLCINDLTSYSGSSRIRVPRLWSCSSLVINFAQSQTCASVNEPKINVSFRLRKEIDSSNNCRNVCFLPATVSNKSSYWWASYTLCR